LAIILSIAKHLGVAILFMAITLSFIRKIMNLEGVKKIVPSSYWGRTVSNPNFFFVILFNPLPLLLKTLLHGQKDCVFSADI